MKRIFFCAALLTALLCGMAVSKTAIQILNEQPRTGNYLLSQIPERLRAGGSVWYVNSESTNSQDIDRNDGIHGTTMDTPFSTIDFAISCCTASKGDTIIVAPTHADANGFHLDVAGVWVIGQGSGQLKGSVSLATTKEDLVRISADDCMVQNLRIIDANVIGTVTTMMQVDGDDCVLRSISVEQGGAAGDANGTTGLTIGVVDGDADHLLIEDCDFYLPDATTWSEGIKFAKDMTGIMIRNTRVRGDFSEAGIDIPAAGNAQVDLLIDNCWLENHEPGDHALQVNGTSSRGLVRNCTFVTDGTYVDAGGLRLDRCSSQAYGTDSDSVGWGDATLASGAISTGSFASGAIDAAAIAANAIGSSELSVSAADKIADQMWTTFDVNGPSSTASVGLGTLGDKMVVDFDANGLASATSLALGRLGDKVQEVLDANSLLQYWTQARANIITDLAGISEIGDKIVADVDANAFSSTASVALGNIGDKAVADIDANAFSATASAALGRIGGKMVADFDANALSATASPALGRIGDKAVADMDANSPTHLTSERCVSKTQASPANASLFSVSGPIEILSITGYVTVNMEGKANGLKIMVDPCTPATDTDLCAVGETNGDAAGTCYVVDGNAADALIQTTNGVVMGTAINGLHTDLTLDPKLTCVARVPACDIEAILDNGTSTGTIIWYMRYRPLASGVTVTAD